MVPPSDDPHDPRPILETFFARVLARPRPRLHIDTKPESVRLRDDGAPIFVGAEVGFFRRGLGLDFNLWFFGKAHPIDVSGVGSAVRRRFAWGADALELHGVIAVRTLEDRRPLLGLARAPRPWRLRSRVLWLVSHRDG